MYKKDLALNNLQYQPYAIKLNEIKPNRPKTILSLKVRESRSHLYFCVDVS